MSQGWLALTRKFNESVMIGNDIEVKVVSISGDKVRLAFRAPFSVDVHRREVFDAIRREDRAARQVKPE